MIERLRFVVASCSNRDDDKIEWIAIRALSMPDSEGENVNVEQEDTPETKYIKEWWKQELNRLSASRAQKQNISVKNFPFIICLLIFFRFASRSLASRTQSIIYCENHQSTAKTEHINIKFI